MWYVYILRSINFPGYAWRSQVEQGSKGEPVRRSSSPHKGRAKPDSCGRAPRRLHNRCITPMLPAGLNFGEQVITNI